MKNGDAWLQKGVNLSVFLGRVFLHILRVMLVLIGLALLYMASYVAYDLTFSPERSFPTVFWIMVVILILFVIGIWIAIKNLTKTLREMKR